MGRKTKHPPEVRERAVRLVFEQEGAHDSRWAAVTSIAEKMGCSAEALRNWMKQAEADEGKGPEHSIADGHFERVEREFPGSEAAKRVAIALSKRWRDSSDLDAGSGGVGGWAAWWGARHPVVAIAVHELGIVRRERGRSVALSWTDIAEVFERTFEHEDMLGKELRGSFTFVAHDGRTLVVDSGVPDWRELGRTASALAQDAMRAAYELGLVAGRPLRFGDLVMDGYGIHSKDGSFPWGAITFVRFERRGHEASWAIHMGAWMVAARVPHERVANARTLVTILDRLGKLDVPGAAVLAEVAGVVEAA